MTFKISVNDAENDTAMALEGGNRISPVNSNGEVRTRRVRQPRPKSAHFNIEREREFTTGAPPLILNGELSVLDKDIQISNDKHGKGNNSNENDVLLRKLRAL